MKKNMKFIIGVTLISASIVYLGVTGFQQEYSYYLFADEFVQKLPEMRDSAYTENYRVAGYVKEGSIMRGNENLRFTLEYNGSAIPVEYVGTGPVPDTFKDLSEAVVDGKYTAEGVFHADKIQAKCASKYTAEPGSIKSQY